MFATERGKQSDGWPLWVNFSDSFLPHALIANPWSYNTFYWTLSDVTYNSNAAIKEWAFVVCSASWAPSIISHDNSAQTAPSLTSGSSHSSAPSVLTNNIKITHLVKTEPEPTPTLFNNGSLSDNKERRGEDGRSQLRVLPRGKGVLPATWVFFLYIIQ